MQTALRENLNRMNDDSQKISQDGAEEALQHITKLNEAILNACQRAQPILNDYLSTIANDDYANYHFDPMNIRTAFVEFLSHLVSNPDKIIELQMEYWKTYFELVSGFWNQFLTGEKAEPLINPQKGDRRFKDPEWQENLLFDFLKQSYLLTSRALTQAVQETEDLDDQTKRKLDFYIRQYADAISPSNFILTNPEVLKETIDSKGENLVRGLENLLEDLERGKGELKISTTDYNAFEVGKNIAVTPGKIIYQNDLMQLIQYAPVTETVCRRPLLIIPPWINKYYILDLRPENSFIKWAIEKGHSVFVISWVNPDEKLARKTFGDYLREGFLEALDQIEKETGEPDCNVIGYCIGGTLLSAALSWLKAKGKENRVASATFLTTLIDFEKSGEMKVFIDDNQIDLLTEHMQEKGYLEGEALKSTFSMLRANDLIWSFVVNNYLMGREPFPFDLLFWNDDSTNMPAAVHSYYLKNMYRDNLLIKPKALEIEGVNIDISRIKTPSYFLSTKEDHIAPWQATYDGARAFSGEVTFTLAASGHVAGVVNPPAKNKYCYWTSSALPSDSRKWLENADEHQGSWWPHWAEWAGRFGNGEVKARKPGTKLKPVEDTPGTYVKMRRDD